MVGIADVLEQDEYNYGKYTIFDYKTWGSYKVGKAMGVTAIEEEVVDNEGNLVLLKSGKNKGKPKTIKSFKTEPENIDLTNETLQLNRYRIMFEKYGFPISKMQIQAVVRDGGTYIAQSRGIERNLYLLDVPRISNSACLKFYHGLQIEVDKAFKDKWIRKCNSHESWEGRRCKGFCEVTEACKKMGD
jgi:CO dehydrogenase/acetyl-CoA synthase delta subunit